ncbi:MAG: phosphatase PAP2 family protein [bacterium]
MSHLAALDTQVFLLVNRHWVHPILDVVMVAVTTFKLWRLPLVAVLLLVLARGKTPTRLAILSAVLAVGVSDQLVANGVKPVFERARPFEVIPLARKLVDAHDASFPSAHAANTFAAGVFLALRFRKMRWWILVLPALVAYSRVYVGVHYPSDVLAGALLGALVGTGFALLDRAARLRLGRRRDEPSDSEVRGV